MADMCANVLSEYGKRAILEDKQDLIFRADHSDQVSRCPSTLLPEKTSS